MFTRLVRPQVPDAELVMVSDLAPPPTAGVSHVAAPDVDTLAELYRSAWVFAYPSVYEGFGLPYLEAMASGTAVVASPNPGAAHVLGPDGDRAAVVDDAAFGPAWVRLLTDADERGRLGRAGLAAVGRFAWDRVADAHRTAYRSAINRWHNRRGTTAVGTGGATQA